MVIDPNPKDGRVNFPSYNIYILVEREEWVGELEYTSRGFAWGNNAWGRMGLRL